MAETVTISTFLELKDNLSPSLGKVEAALNRIAQQSQAMQNRLLQSATAAKQLGPAIDKVVPQFNKIAIATKKIETAFKPITKQVDQLTKSVNKLVDALNKAKNVKPPALPRSAPTPSGGGGGGGTSADKGLFSTLINANLTAMALTAAFEKAASAIKFAFKSAIHYGIEYEKVNTDIAAALFTTKLAPTMDVGKVAAQDLMKTMHDISLKLPGQAADYYKVFSQSLPAAISVGITDMGKYAKFISEYTAVAIKRNVGSARAATDIQMMLQGRARITTNMLQKLIPYIGMTITEFNKLMKVDREKGLLLLMNAVSKAASGMYGASQDAITTFGELQTRIQDIATFGAKPLFQATKRTVVDINTWLEKSRETVNGLASVIATRLGDALRGTARLAISIASAFSSMLGMGEGASGGPRSLGDIAKELEETKNMPMLQKLLYKQSPILSIMRAGKIARLEDEYKEEEAHQKKMTAVRKSFGLLTETAPIGLSAVLGDKKLSFDAITQVAATATERYKAGWFKGHGAEESEAFADYLESQGVTKENIGKIWEKMLKLGAETPLSLPETPTDRATTVNDFRYSRFDIRQEFAEGFDPDRIAVAFATDLGKLADRKLSAATGGPAVGAH